MSADTTLVVRPAEDGVSATATSSSSSSSSMITGKSIVLDALPYVETLDPNYEEYALSLIEEELRQNAGGGSGPHPSLDRIMSSGAKKVTNVEEEASSSRGDFASRAPLAHAAYELLVSRRRAVAEGKEEGMPPPPHTDVGSSFDRYHVQLESSPPPSTTANANDESSRLLSSIANAKARFEFERLRYANLDLQRIYETPSRYAEYHILLENHYLNPTKASVERQRRVVDGINGTRMEEQMEAMRKLEGATRRRLVLVDRNRRLGKALLSLEEEVVALRREADALVHPIDDGGDGNANGLGTMTSASIMEVAEATMGRIDHTS